MKVVGQLLGQPVVTVAEALPNSNTTRKKHREKTHREKRQRENTKRKHRQKTQREERKHRQKTQREERKHRKKTQTENTMSKNVRFTTALINFVHPTRWHEVEKSQFYHSFDQFCTSHEVARGRKISILPQL